MKQILLLIIITMFISPGLIAQQENADIRQGNRDYNSENYQEAELDFREAIEANPENNKALYNLANALYKQGRYDEAANILEGLAGSDLPDNTMADVYHNLGNANIGSQRIKEGIEAFKNALRIRPEDDDTRHNLAYAQQLLQEQQQQQQDQQDQQDDQPQEEDQDQQQQPRDPDSEQEQQERARPDQISPQDAERILDALNQQEQDIQEKIEREEKQRRPMKPERQW